MLLLLPQFLGVLQQAEIIAGHAFVDASRARKRALFDAIVQHTRHLNDYPDPEHPDRPRRRRRAAPGDPADLVAAGGVAVADRLDRALVARRSAARSAFVTGKFSDLFYSDPRRLSAVVTMLIYARWPASRWRRAGRWRWLEQGPPRAWHAVTAAVVRAVDWRLALLAAAPLPARREVRQR